MNSGSILVVPAAEKGRGGGHLTRSMKLARDLRALGRETWLYADRLLDVTGFDDNWLINESGLQDKKWECIILDRFQTPPDELVRWKRITLVIGIDEGGRHRNHFDFLIDILPGLSRIKPNITDPSLLPLPTAPLPTTAPHAEKEHPTTAPLKVLISFGQEDAAGLGIAAAQALTAKNTGSMNITLLHGGSIPSQLLTPHCQLSTINYLPNLNEHLHKYDLVITHYGLTAFETLYAGVPVLLASPGRYHEQLARAAGFYSAGIGKGGAKRLAVLLLHNGVIRRPFLDRLKNRSTALAVKYRLDHAPEYSLAELINGFTPDVSQSCPLCGTAIQSSALARFSERTYRRCKRCGIISMNRLNPSPIAYEREYFFEFYQQQYGKTYLEDFPHLIAMGKRRLAIIKTLLCGENAPPLLDIGCAYGPFLAAAKEEGFSPHGIDPAQDAVRYVTQTLNIPATQGSFPHDYQLPTADYHLYSVITLWYVVEHFRDCVPVLAEIRKLLRPGGVLAFATPSFAGISGRCALNRFLEYSPADHWTIWSPSVCAKALKIAGFTVKKIVISGHHPERFPLWGKLAQNKKNPLYRLLLAASRIFSLGDTFEVYAVKN
jgi:2-polyprenyl-3-methyl-5-hydroxy-6-metoxy-1,4-benzoquinol methylase/spore coat polysaccharide biosynthesis predicted glycosyltransferase SpsG/predicted RNA-binding Zn-ribbon protein involved in translation (DUF1610 family)